MIILYIYIKSSIHIFGCIYSKYTEAVYLERENTKRAQNCEFKGRFVCEKVS